MDDTFNEPPNNFVAKHNIGACEALDTSKKHGVLDSTQYSSTASKHQME